MSNPTTRQRRNLPNPGNEMSRVELDLLARIVVLEEELEAFKANFDKMFEDKQRRDYEAKCKVEAFVRTDHEERRKKAHDAETPFVFGLLILMVFLAWYFLGLETRFTASFVFLLIFFSLAEYCLSESSRKYEGMAGMMVVIGLAAYMYLPYFCKIVANAFTDAEGQV
jgi:hypothetical protein